MPEAQRSQRSRSRSSMTTVVCIRVVLTVPPTAKLIRCQDWSAATFLGFCGFCRSIQRVAGRVTGPIEMFAQKSRIKGNNPVPSRASCMPFSRLQVSSMLRICHEEFLTNLAASLSVPHTRVTCCLLSACSKPPPLFPLYAAT